MKPIKTITVTMHDKTEHEFEAHDFVLMPTGHLTIVHENGVKNLDGTDNRRMVAVFAPGAWGVVSVEDVEKESKIAV